MVFVYSGTLSHAREPPFAKGYPHTRCKTRVDTYSSTINQPTKRSPKNEPPFAKGYPHTRCKTRVDTYSSTINQPTKRSPKNNKSHMHDCCQLGLGFTIRLRLQSIYMTVMYTHVPNTFPWPSLDPSMPRPQPRHLQQGSPRPSNNHSQHLSHRALISVHVHFTTIRRSTYWSCSRVRLAAVLAVPRSCSAPSTAAATRDAAAAIRDAAKVAAISPVMFEHTAQG